jgi:hypothetical protein
VELLPVRAQLAVLVVVVSSILGCGDPRVSIWIDNDFGALVLVRYEQSAGNRVYEIASGASGYLGSFPAPEEQNRLVVLTPGCETLLDPVDIPPTGPVAVTIGSAAMTATPTSSPESFDPPAFQEVDVCGSYREG